MSRLVKLNTPCIGLCSTVYGDEICRGCKRTAQEVIDWNQYDETEKKSVFNRLETVLVTLMQDKMTVIDSQLLQAALHSYQIRHRDDSDPLCWAYHLLRIRANKIDDIKHYGIKIHSPYCHDSLVDLFTLIDNQFLHAARK